MNEFVTLLISYLRVCLYCPGIVLRSVRSSGEVECPIILKGCCSEAWGISHATLKALFCVLIICFVRFCLSWHCTLKRMTECSCRLNEQPVSWSYGMECHSPNCVWGDANGSGLAAMREGAEKLNAARSLKVCCSEEWGISHVTLRRITL